MGIISKVLMCVLMLGLVLQLAQVEGKSCCKNTAARLCYNLSFPNAQTTTGSLCKPMWLYNSKGTNMQTPLSQF